MAVIGIDLGTTYSAAARFVNGVAEIILLDGHPTLPSVVGVMPNGKIAVGWKAKRNQARYPTNTIVEIKRKMGTNETVRLGDASHTPPEISAMILMKIKEEVEAQLGEPITGAVISCPAYFKDPARAATEQAGQLAGLKILRIVNEPTAAAYAYGLREGQAAGGDGTEKLYVVYDLGGGTFDVTVIRMLGGKLEVIGTGGDPQLGGANFDDRIVDWILGRIRATHPTYAGTLTDERMSALRMRLKVAAEESKIALCLLEGEAASFRVLIPQVDTFKGVPIVFDEALTRPAFEGMIHDLLENSLQWIDAALKVPKEKHNYSEEHLTAVLLVGGSTRIPFVRKVLERRFPKTAIWGQEKGINPDEIVAMGASIVAADEDLSGDQAGGGSILVDVTGHTLSVEAVNPDTKQDELVGLIPKDSEIPTPVHAHGFRSQGHGQRMVRIKVYQGEGTDPRSPGVAQIGEFTLDITPIPGETPLRIGLQLDANGLLTGSAVDELTGKSVTCEMKYEGKSKLKPEEVKRRQAQLEARLAGVVGQAANPLAADSGFPPGPGAPAGAGAPGGTRPPPPAAAGAPFDPATAMNPVMRMLYQKAIASFLQVPADRQGALVLLISEIEAAAKAGDKARLDACLPQLVPLLSGVP